MGRIHTRAEQEAEDRDGELMAVAAFVGQLLEMGVLIDEGEGV